MVTAGLGLAPPGSVWSVDFGWSIEWLRPDFDDATDPKESRQQLASPVPLGPLGRTGDENYLDNFGRSADISRSWAQAPSLQD